VRQTPALVVLCCLGTACRGSPPKDYRLVAEWPHDTAAYTQGLLLAGGQLFESDGEYGVSQVRRVDVRTGRTLARAGLPANRFGEGLALLNGKLYELTWKAQVGYVYDTASLARIDSFHYAGEGWGLATDGASLIMSNGGPTLQWLDPETYRVIRVDTVHEGTAPLQMLNELEYVHGAVYANVYQSDWIVRIDPATGTVLQWYDFGGILPASKRTPRTDVLNGIAYNPADSTFLITGKRWPLLFAVRLREGTPPH